MLAHKQAEREHCRENHGWQVTVGQQTRPKVGIADGESRGSAVRGNEARQQHAQGGQRHQTTKIK